MIIYLFLKKIHYTKKPTKIKIISCFLHQINAAVIVRDRGSHFNERFIREG